MNSSHGKNDPITYGQIVIVWYLIYVTARNQGISPQILVRIAQESGKMGGTVPAKESLKLCIRYNLLRITNKQTFLTERSSSLIMPKCKEEDPNYDALREIIFQIISKHNFEWLIFYDTDAEIFEAYINDYDTEWANLLRHSKLFDFSEQGVSDWWARVLAKYETYKQDTRIAIGSVGEKLSYDFEVRRVEIDGMKPGRTFVKWASTISDKYGFDIKSVRGVLLRGLLDIREKIEIEVKASEIENKESFRFFVTRGEWEQAMRNLESYFFHCWTGVNVQKQTAKQGPFIIPATILSPLIPVDTSNEITWHECRCVVNLDQLAINSD